ncbi:hypothetical protein CFC21_005336 [Triticum aestivum]|uniref:Uncharacterized protein n=3 Tax=Triticum TaxID=4564 RepID=A0A9R0QNI5_TRITD|nr:uncharacterized protein LOC123086709 [Triticum aestivum]KAF6987719.1 hypothetical protein CFC21_005336 [Triticum aestivum]VAH13249.1 unnamed protein product [Triticum turgidum subsp. durum]
MASLVLRSAGRLLRRPLSDYAGKIRPNKHSCSKFSTGHGKHIKEEPIRTGPSIMMKLDERDRILSEAHKDIKAMLKQARDNEAWDKLLKKLLLPSSILAALAFWKTGQQMPVENIPPN